MKVLSDKEIISENKNLYAYIDYEDNFLYRIVDGKVYINGFTGDYSKVLVIPDEIDGQIVVGIYNNAFANYITIETVVIPDTITNINEYAFYNCKRLKNVYLPDSVEVIERGAFSGCMSLEKINIPTLLTELRTGLFSGCVNLKELVITENVKKIDGNALGNTGFESIHIPGNVETISNNAFENCYELKTITIDYGLKTVGTNAFNNCISLEEITLPDSVLKLNSGMFEGCINLRKVTIPFFNDFSTADMSPFAEMFSKTKRDNTYEVSAYNSSFAYYVPNTLEEVVITNAKDLPYKAFYQLTSIKKITLPDTLKTIGDNAFYDCTNLEEINIPKDIVIVPTNAFRNCIKLKSILLPIYVQRIDAGAFENTRMDILFVSNKLPVVNVDWNPNNNPTFFNQKRTDEEIKYFTVKFLDSDNLVLKEETVIKGENATAPVLLKKTGYIFSGWNKSYEQVNSDLIIKANYIQNDKIHLIKFVDYDNTLLKEQYVYDGESATVPKNLTRENYEFSGWDKDFENIKSDIEIKAVYNEVLNYTVNIYLNSELTNSFTVSKGSIYNLEDYSGYSYYKGWYSNEIYTEKISSGSVNVDKDLNLYCLFDYNDRFEYTVAGTSAIITGFNGPLPTLLIIPKSIHKYYVTEIDSEAFIDSLTLEEVIVPDGVYLIQAYAFKGNKNLKKLSLGNSIAYIGSGAFQYCSELTEFNIPTSLKELGNKLFEWCTKITEFIVPDHITKIGVDTFSNCIGLTKIYISSSVTTIQNNAFENCINLVDVQIEEGLKFISSGVFSNCKSLEVIVLPNSLVKIDSGIFRNCSSLKKLSIPFLGHIQADYFHIGELFNSWEFENSVLVEYYSKKHYIPKDLEEINITNATRIPPDAFYNVKTIKTIILPNMLTTISANSFAECNIEDLFIPKSVIWISPNSFSNCPAIFYCEIGSKQELWFVDWIDGINVFYSQTRK